MVACYRCGCETCVKNGFMQGEQRYRCKECGYNFIDKPRRGHRQATKALAVWLYVSGLSQRRIGELFGVSTVAIMKWIRGFALRFALKWVVNGGGTVVVELDGNVAFSKKSPPKSGSGRLMIVIEDDSLIGNAGIVIGSR